MNTIEINIAKDFSRYPAGRIPGDGPFCGANFLTEILEPQMKIAIENNSQLTIILDGARGYGSSFLEESFGGYVRKNNNKEQFKKNLCIISEEDESLVDEIYEYIDQAEKE